MANIRNEYDVFLENLQDAGCCQELIERCLILYQSSQLKVALPELRQYRTCILDHIHQEQDKLESLDYLIYQLEK